MKKIFLSLIAVAFLILICGSWSWAQCPEDPNDRGECDTLIVTCLDCEIDTTVPKPYFVHFPLLVTHDQTEPSDSISGFAIPLAYTHTNPSKYCSVTSYWNNTYLYPFPPVWLERSIFRHITDPVTGDTLVHNRMMTLSERLDGSEWDTFILELDGTSHFWFFTIPLGDTCRRWWEGDRVLLATMTFRIQDTMHVCIDTTLWPPTTHVKFGRSDGQTYTPRHNMPKCFWVGPPGQPDFTIEATPDTQTVQAGQSTNYDVILTSLFGFDSPCNLSATGLPDDATADFDPNPVTPTGTSVMSIGTAETTPPGPYEITITATEVTKAQIVHDTTVVLIVTPPPDFTIEVEPDTQEVQVGDAVNFDVILTSLYGFASPCTLTVSGLPPDASGSFDPNPVIPTNTSNLQINTAVTTPPDTYTVTVTASEVTKGIVHDAEFVLIVTPLPDFTIEAEPDTQEVQAGNSVDFDVILTALYGFDSPCNLSATGLPDDASADFDPNPVTPTGTSVMSIGTAETTPPGPYEITITATEVTKAQIVRDTTVVLIVTPPPDFTIEVEPETLEVSQGGEDSYEVILTSLYGFDSACTLEVSGLPQYASGEFDPNTLVPTDTSALTITVADTTLTGTYPLTITATELVPVKGQVEHSIEVFLVVRPPEDFAIEVFPDTLRLHRGNDSSYTVVLTSISGFNSPCTLWVEGLPGGVVGTFDSSILVPTDSTGLNIFVSDTADTGSHTLLFTATEMVGEKTIQHEKEVTLIVTLGIWSFYIKADPDTQEVVVGDSTTYEVVMVANTGFSAPCTLSIESGLPPDATSSFDPEVILPDSTSILTIVTTGSTPAEIYELIIKATVNLKQWDTTTAILMVQDFTISAAPDTQYVTQGYAAGYVVKLTSLFGFDEPCTLLVSGLPDPPDNGVFDQVTLIPTDSTTLTVYTSTETDTIWYTLTITAQRMPGAKPDGLERSIQVMLKVNPSTDAGDWADNPNAPKSFALFQNQPNPFNPETKISYYLPRACQLRLTIYNVLGQRVRTLFDGHQDAGIQTLLWDGRDDAGVQLGSGIYFYRLQADEFHQTKKMTLVK